jgi:hypothetical protein
MANPVLGLCTCPVCTEPGAEVREGAKKDPYIICDNCVTMIKSMSRQGRAAILNRIKPAAPAPDHKVGTGDMAAAAPLAPTPKPAAKPAAPVKMGIFGL